jgi:hypothetical protein
MCHALALEERKDSFIEHKLLPNMLKLEFLELFTFSQYQKYRRHFIQSDYQCSMG